MKRKFFWMIAAVCVIAAFTGVGVFASGQEEAGEEQPVVAFSIMDYSIDFLMELLASARKTAEELGVDLRDYNSQFDTMKQINNIEDAIAQGVDCILVHPVESSAVTPAVESANDAGIPIVAVDIMPSGGKLECFVASDNTNIGRMAGEVVIDNLKEKYGEAKGNIVVLGNDMISSMRLRKIGLKEVFAEYSGIRIVDTHDFATKLPATIEVTENVLQKYSEGELDFIVALNSTQTIGAVSTVASANRFDVLVMGIDKDVDILNAIKDPKSPLVGTIVQSPSNMGKIAVENCLKAIKGEPIEQDFIEAPVQVVTKVNIDEYFEYAKTLNAELDPYRVK